MKKHSLMSVCPYIISLQALDEKFVIWCADLWAIPTLVRRAFMFVLQQFQQILLNIHYITTGIWNTSSKQQLRTANYGKINMYGNKTFYIQSKSFKNYLSSYESSVRNVACIVYSTHIILNSAHNWKPWLLCKLQLPCMKLDSLWF